LDLRKLNRTLDSLRQRLLAERTSEGCWKGELSASALATATAVCALAQLGERRREHVRRGLAWLAEHANANGGWGDTTRSGSNLSTTVLGWCAFAAAGADADYAGVVAAAAGWIGRQAGSLEADALAEAVSVRYGGDRTFSAPILAMGAISGRLGEGPESWRHVAALPFELAAFSHRTLRLLRVPVVSYALPALIAVGQARHAALPGGGLLRMRVRNALRRTTLRKLEAIQPSGGGYLEAIPLTAFVLMCLASMNLAEHAVARRAEAFLLRTVRPDGSWPIDVDLGTWLTSLSVEALAAGSTTRRWPKAGAAVEFLGRAGAEATRDWLLACQKTERHPYTGAAAGGWAWTNSDGGVPDADDTAGAVIALARLTPEDERSRAAALAGMEWLVRLQNRDGGIPTFCRGWTNLPFDRSAADLTAHALRAWRAWESRSPRTARASARGLGYLLGEWRPDKPWRPLWFGNEHAPQEANPVFGTARVVSALAEMRAEPAAGTLAAAARYLLRCQHTDGGWGGDAGVRTSIEEAAVATDALAKLRLTTRKRPVLPDEELLRGVRRGAEWLIQRAEGGGELPAAPIGLYFASLWYHERLYPLIFTVSALGRAAACLA